jgi:N-acetylmuramoyl-L-alanine amidase
MVIGINPMMILRSLLLLGFFSLGLLTTHGATIKPEDLLQDPSPEAWKALENYNNTFTRGEFEERLKDVFDPTGALAPYLKISDQQVEVFAQTNSVKSTNQLTPAAVITFASNSVIGPSPSPAITPSPLASPTLSPPSSPVPGISPLPSPSPAPPTNTSFFSLLFDSFFSPTPTPTPEAVSLATAKLPLAGLRVAIEPADIGGDWGSMEDRSTIYPGFGRIQEGDLNLLVSKILSERLKQEGAEVFVTRTTNAPVCTLSVAEVQQVVPQVLAHRRYLLSKTFRSRTASVRESSPIYQKIVAEVLLTKNLEAKARAEKTRAAMKPDVTIVLQFDATSARHEANFPKINRNILFVSGAYTAREITSDPQQRLRLLTKLLQNVTPTEAKVAKAISDHLVESTGFPPVHYGNSWSTRSIPGNSYVVARNLLLNREHDGPVVVTEPYFMNQEETLLRLLAGDYEGTKLIAGKARVSIYREYANSVADGLLEAYGK